MDNSIYYKPSLVARFGWMLSISPLCSVANLTRAAWRWKPLTTSWRTVFMISDWIEERMTVQQRGRSGARYLSKHNDLVTRWLIHSQERKDNVCATKDFYSADIIHLFHVPGIADQHVQYIATKKNIKSRPRNPRFQLDINSQTKPSQSTFSLIMHQLYLGFIQMFT